LRDRLHDNKAQTSKNGVRKDQKGRMKKVQRQRAAPAYRRAKRLTTKSVAWSWILKWLKMPVNNIIVYLATT
jgi:hypothetical protein